RLLETVRDIWVATALKEPPTVSYASQIGDRLPELFALHPRLESLRHAETRIFGIRHRSLGEMLDRVRQIEGTLAPPVAVRLHGDFNTNNIVYDAGRDRVHYIDVHRSGHGDYLQDIGVLLVSNLRNPIQDPRVMAELRRVNRLVYEFASDFARRVGDAHFEARLALSEARSFITSGRLVSDFEFARVIFLQGVRLLEQATD